MHYRLIFFFLTIICVNGTAQTMKMCDCKGFEFIRDTVVSEGPKEEEPCYFSEKAPVFPGGEVKLNRFCKSNSSYNIVGNEDLNNGIEFERVFVCLEIDKTGTIMEKKIRTSNDLYRADVLRIISLMPKWIPATQSKRSVFGRYTFEINYKK